eukprot:482670-Rhodomonas_salina.2
MLLRSAPTLSSHAVVTPSCTPLLCSTLFSYDAMRYTTVPGTNVSTVNSAVPQADHILAAAFLNKFVAVSPPFFSGPPCIALHCEAKRHHAFSVQFARFLACTAGLAAYLDARSRIALPEYAPATPAPVLTYAYCATTRQGH